MNDEESRSERLRKRRSESAERREAAEPDETDETTQTAEQDESSKPSKPDKPEEQSEPSVKDEQVGTYMYLPKSQKKEMERVYTVLKAEYEYEFEENFEKNRHFYPLVVQYGLDELDGLDASEIRERL